MAPCPSIRRTLPALVFAALWLGGCDSLPGKPTEADRFVLPSDVVDFDSLYGANCAGCHGAAGELGPARNLNDPLYLAVVSDDELRAIVADGVPESRMPAFAERSGGTLTDHQVDVLVGELRTRWGRPDGFAGVALPHYRERGAVATGLARPASAARGRAAYATYCRHCHGSDGSGGSEARSIVDGSYLALVSDQALRSAVIFGRTDLGMPDYREYEEGRPMSFQEIADVTAWMVAQRRPFPGQPYPEERARTPR